MSDKSLQRELDDLASAISALSEALNTLYGEDVLDEDEPEGESE